MTHIEVTEALRIFWAAPDKLFYFGIEVDRMDIWQSKITNWMFLQKIKQYMYSQVKKVFQ